MNANMAYGFTETELDIARHTDLPDLLSSLGYTLKRIGSYLSAPMIKCKKTPRKKCSFVAEVEGKR